MLNVAIRQRRRSRVARLYAESRSKVLVRGWASPFDDWKTLSVNPAVNVYLFELGKDKAAKGEGWARPFICFTQDRKRL